MGDGAATTITRFVRADESGDHAFPEYDFSSRAIAASKLDGYSVAKKTIGEASGSSGIMIARDTDKR